MVQSYLYFNATKDGWGLKLFVSSSKVILQTAGTDISNLIKVGTLLALDFVTTALASQSVHFYLVRPPFISQLLLYFLISK